MKKSVSTKFNLGFTIIELLVATSILMVLTAVAIVSFTGSLESSRNQRRRADLEMVRAALEMYRTAQPTRIYPVGVASDTIAGGKTRFDTITGSTGALMSPTKFLSTTVRDPVNTSPLMYMYFANTAGTAYDVCTYLETDSATSVLSGISGSSGCNGSVTSVAVSDDLATQNPNTANESWLCCLTQP